MLTVFLLVLLLSLFEVGLDFCAHVSGRFVIHKQRHESLKTVNNWISELKIIVERKVDWRCTVCVCVPACVSVCIPDST